MKRAGFAARCGCMIGRMRWRLVVPAGLSLALAAAAMLLPWVEVLAALRAARVSLLLAAIALNIAVFPLWIWQWRWLATPLAEVSWRRMAEVVALSITAKVSLSGLAGVSGGLLALRYRAGLSYAQAGSLMTVDQVLALVTKGLVLGLAVALLPLPAATAQAAWGLGALLLMLLAALGLARRLRGAGLGLLQGPIAALRAFLDELARLGASRVLAGGLALALVKKALEIAAALAVQLACGIEAPPAAAVLVVAAVSLTTLVPVMPANLGAHSAGVFMAYRVLDVPADQAAAAGLLHHAALLLASGAIALAGLWLSRP